MLDEGVRRLTLQQAHPLDSHERLRNVAPGLGHGVDRDGHYKHLVARHQVSPLVGKAPLESEVALVALKGIGRDEGHEERTVLDLPADPLVPEVPSPKVTLVEPHLNAACPEGFADAVCCLGILRGIAEKDCVLRCAHGRVVTSPTSTPSRNSVVTGFLK